MINLSADIAVFNIDVSEAEIRETMQTDIATGWISVWHKYAVTSYAYIYRIVLHEELSEEILFSSFSFMQEKGDFFSKEGTIYNRFVEQCVGNAVTIMREFSLEKGSGNSVKYPVLHQLINQKMSFEDISMRMKLGNAAVRKQVAVEIGNLCRM